MGSMKFKVGDLIRDGKSTNSRLGVIVAIGFDETTVYWLEGTLANRIRSYRNIAFFNDTKVGELTELERLLWSV